MSDVLLQNESKELNKSNLNSSEDKFFSISEVESTPKTELTGTFVLLPFWRSIYSLKLTVLHGMTTY